ncbi:MAG TPA: TonB family protein [Vicinamibacterales bacterium]|nr:TonB family protein [Vicinamibacterales bacterium]
MSEALAAAAPIDDQRAFSRMLRWSFIVHAIALVLVFVVPSSWWRGNKPEPIYMHVSLAGALGPETTGMTSIGGRTVEQVVPPTKRPDPVPVTPPKPAPASPNKVVKPPEKPVETTRPPTPGRPVPSTGQQIQTGTARVETGARGNAPGLAQGGGQGGVDAEIAPDFCCPEYIVMMKVLLEREWNKALPGRGTTIMLFTIQRDGTITDVQVQTSSGDPNLDFEAKRAVTSVKLQPLPAAYTDKSLTVRLRFPYGGA